MHWLKPKKKSGMNKYAVIVVKKDDDRTVYEWVGESDEVRIAYCFMRFHPIEKLPWKLELVGRMCGSAIYRRESKETQKTD